MGKPKLEQILQSSFPPFNQTASIFCNITYTFYKKDWQTQKDLQGRAQNCTYSQKYVRMHKFLYTCGILRRLKSRGYDLLQGNCNGRGGSSAGEWDPLFQECAQLCSIALSRCQFSLMACNLFLAPQQHHYQLAVPTSCCSHIMPLFRLILNIEPVLPTDLILIKRILRFAQKKVKDFGFFCAPYYCLEIAIL